MLLEIRNIEQYHRIPFENIFIDLIGVVYVFSLELLLEELILRNWTVMEY